jgi:transcriptional regulator with XRE-family HTH domain
MRHQFSKNAADDIGKILGRSIALRRKTLKLTQNDLATLLEVDAETVSRFERGTVLPSLQRLSQIAQALQMGMGDLLTHASSLRDDQASRLVQIIGEIEEKDRRLLLAFAELLRARTS